VDLLWSLELMRSQAAATAAVTGETAQALRHLPIGGIEVEGTSPTTQTMAADVANIGALGVRLGFLIVSEKGEAGIYRRAARAIRSVRQSLAMSLWCRRTPRGYLISRDVPGRMGRNRSLLPEFVRPQEASRSSGLATSDGGLVFSVNERDSRLSSRMCQTFSS
jgi:hypothetical protein